MAGLLTLELPVHSMRMVAVEPRSLWRVAVFDHPGVSFEFGLSPGLHSLAGLYRQLPSSSISAVRASERASLVWEVRACPRFGNRDTRSHSLIWTVAVFLFVNVDCPWAVTSRPEMRDHPQSFRLVDQPSVWSKFRLLSKTGRESVLFEKRSISIFSWSSKWEIHTSWHSVTRAMGSNECLVGFWTVSDCRSSR